MLQKHNTAEPRSISKLVSANAELKAESNDK